MIQEKNYRLLMQIAPEILSGKKNYLKLNAGEAMMPLVVEHLYGFRISLTHYCKQNGDMMKDPDMEIVINRKMETASARTFQQDNMGIYQTVEDENGAVVCPKLAKELDEFLNSWLANILDQDYVDKIDENMGEKECEEMATRSYICRKIDSASCEATYCHSDGYISGVGQTLIDHYNTDIKALAVSSVGYLSSLCDDLQQSIEYATAKEDSEIIEIQHFLSKDFRNSSMINYVYLWNGLFWQVLNVNDGEKFVLLKPLVDMLVIEKE